LLVATPPLIDPNFDRTVVLMIEHDADGAFGLVLNRPTNNPVATVLPGWGGEAAEPSVLFGGGPVQPDAVIALAHRSPPANGAEAADSDGFMPVLADIGHLAVLGTVDVERDPVDVGPFDALRVFVGYSGWGPSQLDGELARDAWIVVEAEIGDAFWPVAPQLWRRVLGRQPGSLGWMGSYPDDVSVN
jgi:putative transcriptional regulator